MVWMNVQQQLRKMGVVQVGWIGAGEYFCEEGTKKSLIISEVGFGWKGTLSRQNSISCLMPF